MLTTIQTFFKFIYKYKALYLWNKKQQKTSIISKKIQDEFYEII